MLRVYKEGRLCMKEKLKYATMLIVLSLLFVKNEGKALLYFNPLYSIV